MEGPGAIRSGIGNFRVCQAHGKYAFTFATEFRIAGEERVIATAETVYVYVQAHTLEKMPLPAEFRAALAEGAKGKVMDHAGYLGSSTNQMLEQS